MNSRLSLPSLSIIILLVICTVCFAKEYNFRKTTWGMPMQEVKASEPLEPQDSKDEALLYKTIILDKNVYLGYFFVEDKLVRAKYILAEEHSNKNDFIHDYKQFQEIVSKKYGKPIKENVYWRNSLFKKDSAHWGDAISMGHLSYFSEWGTNDTKILCFLYGDNYVIHCGVEYCSKKLQALEKEKKEKKNLKNF
jgi:hypothetical protein